MIVAIRNKIENDEFEFSRHATDQSVLRNIKVDEIRQAFLNGKIIEDYPDDKYGQSCLILGYTKNNRALHIQCSYPSRSLIKIITIYEPSAQEWIDDKNEGKYKMVRKEQLVEQKVTYSIFMDDKFYIIENVPARVNRDTGEQYFSPGTVEKIHNIIHSQPKPVKTITTPVFEFV